MASIEFTVAPFTVPTTAFINLPYAGGAPAAQVEIPLSAVPEDTLAAMLEDFSTAVFEKAGRAA